MQLLFNLLNLELNLGLNLEPGTESALLISNENLIKLMSELLNKIYYQIPNTMN